MGNFTNIKRYGKQARTIARKHYYSLSYAERDEIGLTEPQYIDFYLRWVEVVVPIRLEYERLKHKKLFARPKQKPAYRSSSSVRF